MLSFVMKKWVKWVLMVIIPLSIFLNSSPLSASQKTPLIRPCTYKSYVFRASYELRTSSSPIELLVELIGECNDSSGPCHGNVWIPMLQLMELRFTLDGTPKKVAIFKGPSPRKYTIYGLDKIHSSVWYPAIKKLANELGEQCYGKRHFKKKPLSEMNLKPTSSYIYIKPLKNLTLQTKDTLGMRPATLTRDVDVEVTVQLETNQKGKKVPVAHVIFTDRPMSTPEENWSATKFTYTKKGLKQLPIRTINISPLWFPSIKKVARRSISRYFRCMHRHSRVTRAVEIQQRHLQATGNKKQ